jgi:DMSO/TMAO reductase YedYZ molybdopterin-dependent catalytic subunit
MNKLSTLKHGLLAGVVLTIPLIALFFLGDALFGLPLAPFDLFEWLTRVLPGPLVTFGIDRMVDTLGLLGLNVADTAKTAERVLAVGIFFTLGLVAVIVFFLIRSRIEAKEGDRPGLLLGLLLGIPLALTSVRTHPFRAALWPLALTVIWGAIVERVYRALRPPDSPPEVEPVAVSPAGSDALTVEQLDRRRFLVRMGGAAAAITVVGAAVSLGIGSRRERDLAAAEGGGTGPQTAASSPTPPPVAASVPSEDVVPAPGTRPEITPLDQHYQIDINLRPLEVDGAAWRLAINGLVATPLSLSLADIQNNYEPVEQIITLSCISNRVGGSLIGTATWTGARLQDVLDDAGVLEGATDLNIVSLDGFHESLALHLLEQDPRIMLAYAWDGVPLEPKHGFPLRIWIPDRYGMKQPKWIDSIEVSDRTEPGYWVTRGWDQVARVRTTSVIDAVDEPYQADDGSMAVPVGGIAYAGARGISRVEVRVDDGDWEEARLRTPLSDTTWVIWRYDWPFTEGRHVFQVRCFEADGTPQIARVSDPRPSGATGIDEVRTTL